MPDDVYQSTLPTVAAGRAAVVPRLRALATRIDELPLDAATEVLILVEPALAMFERQATLALERAPAGSNRSQWIEGVYCLASPYSPHRGRSFGS
jgi:hypothetical protein